MTITSERKTPEQTVQAMQDELEYRVRIPGRGSA